MATINLISGSINVSDSGDDSVKVISKLGDRPNQDNNLTADQLKGKFDAAAVIIGNFVNTIKTTVNQIISVVNTLNFTTAGVVKTTSSAVLSSGLVGTSDIAAKAVTTAKLDDGAVTAGQLATNAVETAKIKNNAVTNSKMAQNSVSDYNIQEGAVKAKHLGDDVDYEAVGVHVVTSVPTSSSPDGIYLVVGS